MDQPRDLDPRSSNWLVRAYHTPASDALRGQLSARLDVRTAIAEANLPEPIARLIYTVARRTRLWRREKLDVARELIAHFSDGLAAGRSSEQLVKDFGASAAAAKLIRKAKRRCRPLYWQTWWYLSRSLLLFLGVCIVGYALLAARFYLSSPTIAHNYWNDINEARRVPEVDRAWPLYREALAMLGKADENIIGEYCDATPDNKHWPELIAALDRHPESIALAREAARKPRFGQVFGDPADNEVARGTDGKKGGLPSADKNPILLLVLLPGIQESRSVARLLIADARRSAVVGDGQAVMADLTALLRLSEQMLEEPSSTVVEYLVGIAIFGVFTHNTGWILAEYPQVLDDKQLRDLAHSVASYRNGEIRVDFSGESYYLYDLLQRIYSDDGNGNGHLTPEGFRVLHELGERVADVTPRPHEWDRTTWELLAGPGVAGIVGSRQENRELYDSVIDESIAAHQGPPWNWDYAAIHAPEDRFAKLTEGQLGKFRYAPAQALLPAVAQMFIANERMIQQRDALEVAIALVLWHRQHGQWPERLDQLVPDLLPAVPPDRVDGKPLRYVVRDGKPLVYCLGRDHDDDRGRPTENPFDAWHGFGPPDPKNPDPYPAGSQSDGDWILWPPLPEPTTEQNAEPTPVGPPSTFIPPEPQAEQQPGAEPIPSDAYEPPAD